MCHRILKDIYKRYFKPDPTGKAELRLLHIGTIVFGLIGLGNRGLQMLGIKSVLMCGGYFRAFCRVVCWVSFVSIMSRQTKGGWALAAVVGGILVILWLTFSPELAGRFWLSGDPVCISTW